MSGAEAISQTYRHHMTYLRLFLLLSIVCISGCSTIGHRFKSDPTTLSMLKVGETTPYEAVRILGGQPYIRQNLPDGTLAWHWQHIESGAYIGVTDNRYIVLIFKSTTDAGDWRFSHVMHAQNIDLPPTIPFGSVVQ